MTTIHDIIRWDAPSIVPIRTSDFGLSLSNMRQEMNRLFDHLYNGSLVHLTDWDKKLPAAPAVDVSENTKSFLVRLELAGLDPKKVDIEVGQSFLTVKGRKEEEKKEQDDSYIRQEISYGSFYRMIALPNTADTSKAEAKFKNGILTVEIPKTAEALQNLKKLQIKKAA